MALIILPAPLKNIFYCNSYFVCPSFYIGQTGHSIYGRLMEWLLDNTQCNNTSVSRYFVLLVVQYTKCVYSDCLCARPFRVGIIILSSVLCATQAQIPSSFHLSPLLSTLYTLHSSPITLELTTSQYPNHTPLSAPTHRFSYPHVIGATARNSHNYTHQIH